MNLKRIVLPKGDDPGTKNRIYQSNRVTTAQYSYTLIQERIFNFTMFTLQAVISDVMNGRRVDQLDMFRQASTDVKIVIPLKYIATPAQYDRVKIAAKGMVSALMTMKTKGLHGQDVISFAGLFSEITMDEQRSASITCYMRQKVAQHLIQVDINENGKPKNYTGYLLEVALGARNKYTPRMYKLISSWKEKGGLYITLEDLRNVLCLGDKYQDYNDIKKRILIPTQEELKLVADCWYNMSEVEEVKDGKKVVALRLKIVNVDLEKQRELLLHNLYSVIYKFSKISQEQWAVLEPVLRAVKDVEELHDKIAKLAEIVLTRYDIKNKAEYVYKSLLNEFQQ